ncbi:MAG: hypothetical protein ACHQUC_08610 [Chlamydiales bacterium]
MLFASSELSAPTPDLQQLLTVGHLPNSQELKQLLAVVSGFTFLSELDLSSKNIGNSSRETQIEQLRGVIRELPSLTTINLSRNRLGPTCSDDHDSSDSDDSDYSKHSMRRIELRAQGDFSDFSGLSNAITGRPSLTSLDMSANYIPYEYVAVLGLDKLSLRSLNLGSNSFGYLGMRKIASHLPSLSSSLTSLDLSKNIVGDFHACSKELAHGLMALTNLTSLNLGTNNIKDFSDLTPVFKSLTKLMRLDLTGNFFNLRNMQLLSPAIEDHPSLSSLCLGKPKEGMGVEGIRVLAPAIVSLRLLSELDISDHKIGPEGVQILNKAIIDKTGLTSLNLGSNNVDSKGIQNLLPTILALTNLSKLCLLKNAVDEQTARAFLKHPCLTWYYPTESQKKPSESLFTLLMRSFRLIELERIAMETLDLSNGVQGLVKAVQWSGELLLIYHYQDYIIIRSGREAVFKITRQKKNTCGRRAHI